MRLQERGVPASLGSIAAAVSGVLTAALYLQGLKHEALIALLACALFSGLTAYIAVDDAFELMRGILRALGSVEYMPEAPPPRPFIDPPTGCVVGALLPPSVGLVLVGSIDSVHDIIDWFSKAAALQGLELAAPPARRPPPPPALILSALVVGLPALVRWYYKRLSELNAWLAHVTS